MVTSLPDTSLFSARHIKLYTLVRLRWLAIFGQSAAVLFVWFGLGYDFQGGLCLILVGLSAWLNFYLHFHFRKDVRLSAVPATILLSYDSAQLGGLLYLTGGLQNPFALLLLVPAVVSATTQPARYTLFLSALITVIATLLIWIYLPLPWQNATPPDLPLLYVVGIWASIIVTMLFLSIYAFRIAQEARDLADALSVLELILAKEQHLSNLDGLATAAAHELGTPLATIQLVTRELQRELLDDDPIREDIDLLRNQSERCRDILGKLRSLSGDEHHNFTKLRLTALLAEITDPFTDTKIAIKQHVPEDLSDQPVLMRNPGLLYGLGNLLENAVDFAHGQVDIFVRWTDTTLTMQIMDDGPGFAEAILGRLGDPYVTTRSLKAAPTAETTGEADDLRAHQSGINGGGLGLGFFIAKTLLERTGARVTFSNRQTVLLPGKAGKGSKELPEPAFLADALSPPGHGAIVHISWQRSQLEADQ